MRERRVLLASSKLIFFTSTPKMLGGKAVKSKFCVLAVGEETLFFGGEEAEGRQRGGGGGEMDGGCARSGGGEMDVGCANRGGGETEIGCEIRGGGEIGRESPGGREREGAAGRGAEEDGKRETLMEGGGVSMGVCGGVNAPITVFRSLWSFVWLIHISSSPSSPSSPPLSSFSLSSPMTARAKANSPLRRVACRMC